MCFVLFFSALQGLREEICGLQQRIRELETQNRALTTLLVQQLQNQVRKQLRRVASPFQLEQSSQDSFFHSGACDALAAGGMLLHPLCSRKITKK